MRKYQENRKSETHRSAQPPPLPTQTKPRQPGSSSQKTCKSGIKPPAPPTPTTPPNPAPNTPPRTAGPQTPPTQARMKLPQPRRSTPRQSQYSPTPSGPRKLCADPTRIRPKDKINHTGEFWKTAISKAYEKFKGFSRDLILFWIVASCRAVTL